MSIVPAEKIRVLIVDDSRVVRATLSKIIESEDDMEVMGVASDPYEAVELMRSAAPDVIILDLEMPRMDGLTFLGKIMRQHPIPVVICSAYVGANSGEAVIALERGAVEVISKPKVGTLEHLNRTCDRITDAVRAASLADVTHSLALSTQPPQNLLIPTAKRLTRLDKAVMSDRGIFIGASTGGTEAIHQILQSLPTDVPGIMIAQHMPAAFTTAFARRMNDQCALTVLEAQGGELLEPGVAYVAPGDRHAMVTKDGTGFRISVTDTQKVNRHRPSVDVLFRSAAETLGGNAMGLLLTGMGNDGAKGLLEMRHSGAHTVAQDEYSSVVYGMPAAARQLGAADKILTLRAMPAEILSWVSA